MSNRDYKFSSDEQAEGQRAYPKANPDQAAREQYDTLDPNQHPPSYVDELFGNLVEVQAESLKLHSQLVARTALVRVPRLDKEEPEREIAPTKGGVQADAGGPQTDLEIAIARAIIRQQTINKRLLQLINDLRL